MTSLKKFKYNFFKIFREYEHTQPTEGLSHVIFYEIFTNVFPIAFFLYILFFVNLPFLEESTGFRIIQKIQPSIYWVTYFLSDFVIHATLCGLFIGITWILDIHHTLKGTYFYLYLIFTIIGSMYFLIIYILAKSFVKISTILIFLSLTVLSSGKFYFIFLLTTKIYTLINIFFECLGIGQFILAMKRVNKDSFWYILLRLIPDFNIRVEISALNMDYQGRYDPKTFLFVCLVEAILLLAIIIFIYENIYISTAVHEFLVKYTSWKMMCGKKVDNISNNNATETVDRYVEEEKNAVQSIINNNQVQAFTVLVSQLKKNYINVPAVKGIDFLVEKGQCFGLLGMNGAGKTTVFKMMTLNASITDGQIFLHGLNSKSDDAKYKKVFGYCPEMSALLDFMTSYEMLKYMAWIKGTSTTVFGEGAEANLWLRRMDLLKYRNVLIRNYSGGTKRKLNTALAMISNPLVIFLDEPTTGVDPRSRRFMWSCIKKFQKQQNTVILTSHR